MHTNNLLPLFDSLQHIDQQTDYSYLAANYCQNDIMQARSFLISYKGSQGTFNSYRREIERLIHWSATIANKQLADLRRADIESFIEFSKSPPKHWIGLHKPPRFIEQDARIAQIYFHENAEGELYDGQFQNDKQRK